MDIGKAIIVEREQYVIAASRSGDGVQGNTIESMIRR
jgi:hypothetical protein